MIDLLLAHAYSKPLAIAFIGGFFLNMMNLYQDSKRPKNERTTKDLLYWVMFAFWPLAAIVLAFLYLDSGNKIGGWLAFHIGISAPVVLQSLIEKIPAPPLQPKNAEPN